MDSLNNFVFSTCSRIHRGKKTVKKKGVEYHHGPGKVRRVVGGGQKRRRRGTCIADYFSPPPFSIHVHTLAHVHTHTHMQAHTHAHRHTSTRAHTHTHTHSDNQ